MGASSGFITRLPSASWEYYPSDWDTGDKERNVELADDLNEKLGVTPVQRQAMEIGSMAGWTAPGADPKNYEQQEQMGGMKFG